VRALFADPTGYDTWAVEWRCLAEEDGRSEERAAAMKQVNPEFIPRNHLVEAVIRAAVDQQNLLPFEELLEVVVKPLDEQPERERYSLPAQRGERVMTAFCGT
jgi:uncharacterized protein YdiU (UPF0061 family)